MLSSVQRCWANPVQMGKKAGRNEEGHQTLGNVNCGKADRSGIIYGVGHRSMAQAGRHSTQSSLEK